jgi:lipopolysaccharide export system protein LptC
MMRRRSLVAITLFAVAAAGGLAVWQLRPAAPLPPINPSRSDYILENFELTSLDEAGKESFSVKAPRLERDPRGKSLTLQLPQFSFPDKDGGRWLATSQRAWVAEKGVEVRLIDKVELVGPPTPTGDRTRFSTAQLQIFPKQDLALSQDRVTIRRADSILQGTGLRADMRSKRIQLLDDVKGRYAPPTP